MNINLANDIISGTCRLTNGSAIVYGDNTNWLASVEPGFLMFIANTFYQIDRVVAAAELLLTLPFEASAGDGGQANPDGSLTYSFQIIPTHAYTLGVNVRLDELVSKLDQQIIDLPIPPANSLGNAQLASMPPGTIKARFAGSAGDPQDITPAQLAQMLENAGYRFASGDEADGSLVPIGGQTGMVLLKNSDVSGDTAWAPINSLTGATSAGSFRGPWSLFLENVSLSFDDNIIPDYIGTNAKATPLRIVIDPDAVNNTNKALTFPPVSNGAQCEAEWRVYASPGLNTLRVRYKVQSEAIGDPFIIFVDQVEVYRDSGNQQLWNEFTYELPYGEHLVKFGFYTDTSVTAGFQNVRWSQIEFPRQLASGSYNYGDTVEADGSIWFCLKKGTLARPGFNEDWKPLGEIGAGGASLPPGGTAGQVLTKVSAEDGDAEWLDPEVALGAGWQLLSTLGTPLTSGQTHNFGTTPVTELDIPNLAPYTDLRIVMVGVGSVTNGFRWLRVSHDNGATFQTIGYREMVSDFNGGTFNFIENASLQRRWGFMELRNIKGATFFPRVCSGDGRGSGMAIYENNPADINAIRIGSSGGAMNSGYVMVYGRRRETISGETNLSPPSSTLLNQTVGSNFTATFGSRSLLLTSATINPSGIVGRGRNVSGSTTMTCRLRSYLGEDFNWGGIYATDGTKYVVMNSLSNGGPQIARENWSNRTTFTSNFGNRFIRGEMPNWFRMVYNAGAGTLTLQLSMDGDNWIAFETGNNYLGSSITQMGVAIARVNSGIGPSLWVEHVAFS